MIGAVIQTRMGSSRLPGKVLLKLDEGSVLDYVINQVKYCKLVNKIIIATTNLLEDNVIIQNAKDNGVQYFRGHPTDVLDRYYQCAKEHDLSTIIRITSDCPLIDPEIVDLMIRTFNENTYDYISNNKPKTFPYGLDVEVFSFNALENAWKNAQLPSEREHVTSFIYKNLDKFHIHNIEFRDDFSKLRLTIDRINDFKLIQIIVGKIKSRPILIKDILEIYKKEPKLFEINQNYVTDEGYLKSLKEDEEVLRKK